MSVDHRITYRERARDYDRLVLAEDCDGALGEALAALGIGPGSRVVEVGAGTGRVTRILLDLGAGVTAFEPSEAMLAVAREHLGGRAGCALALGDARSIAAPSGGADAAVAGWVLGHFRHWYPEAWRQEIGRALQELRRSVRPGGTVAIVETLGTGASEPSPPDAALAEYYAWLEGEHGFERRAIRTDYRFGGVDEAAEVTGAFFGAAFAERVRREGWARVPECTGVWTRCEA
jgi:ubiquinone/menaquinone biosynthesis C-methylase UbiE